MLQQLGIINFNCPQILRELTFLYFAVWRRNNLYGDVYSRILDPKKPWVRGLAEFRTSAHSVQDQTHQHQKLHIRIQCCRQAACLSIGGHKRSSYRAVGHHGFVRPARQLHLADY